MSGDYMGPLHETPIAPATIVRRVEGIPRWIEAPGIYRLRYLGDPVLSHLAVPFDFEADAVHLQGLLTAMMDVIDKHKAAGLSAPQVGAGVRVIVVRAGKLLVPMINPVIKSRSFKMARRLEGCLSIPGWATHTTRNDGITVSYVNDRFGEQEQSIVGHPAQAVQHEIDHLNGIMLTDRVSDKQKRVAEGAVAKARAKG